MESEQIEFEAGVPYSELIGDLMVSVFGSSGLRLSVLDENGVTVSRQNTKGEFCDFMLNSPALEEMCHACTPYGLKIARETRRSFTFRCHMGLAVTIIPIFLAERLVSYLIFSGYRMEPEKMEQLPTPAERNDLLQTVPALRERYEDVVYFSEDRLQEIVRMLTIMVEYLLKIDEHTRMVRELQNRSLELLSNANLREQREKKVIQNKMQDLMYRFRDEFTFDAMNHIVSVAMEENAPRTAELVYELALRTRKGHTAQSIISLGQDLEDLKHLLHIQQSMYGERVRFSLEVDPSCDLEQPIIQIPFATLIELFLVGALEEQEQGGALHIRVRQTQRELEITVADNCGAYSAETLRRLNRMQFTAQEEDQKVLIFMQNELRKNYNGNVRWCYTGVEGEYTALTLYLPLDRGDML